MKIKLFLALITGLFIMSCCPAQAQEPTPAGVDTTLPTVPAPGTVKEVSELPDSLCVTVKGERICLPTNDAETAANIIKEVVEENKGIWPKNLMGWITFLIAFAFSVKGTQLLASAKGVYNFLRIFLRKAINVVVFIAAGFSAGVTLLIGKGSFDPNVFVTLWGLIAIVAVIIYENWIKKPEPAPTA